MMALVMHEARILGRRGAWPAALAIHAIAASLFVVLWAPTGGVPLWQASVFEQLAALDRLLIAVALTWLSTFVLADDERGRRSMIDWSALSGRRTQTILRARIAAIAMMSLVFVSVALPAFVAAAEVSAAPLGELAAQAGAMLGFTCFCLGVTSVVSVTINDRVATWCIAMAVSIAAAVGVRMLDTTVLRTIVPGVAGVVLLLSVPNTVKSRRLTSVS